MTVPVRVSIVGHVCIDENVGDDESVTRAPGSPAVYMVGEFEQLSFVEAAVIAPFGRDFQQLSPGTPLLTRPGERPTLLYRNLFVDGHRHQECRHTDGADAAPLDHAARRRLAHSDIVIVAPLLDTFSAEYIEQIVASVPRAALKVLLPQGYFRQVGADHRVSQTAFADYARILPFFDLVIFSDEDCDNALDRATEYSSQIPQTRIVVTQNKHGATLFEAGGAVSVAATPVETVDSLVTIGAGDVFSAHLAVAYSASRDLVGAVTTANAAAGRFLETEQLRLAPIQAALSA
ncbi:MAG: carbohydrate kinase family protein [Subtercola sp.]|jgi:sugar/nucleoside kinase (ribokinase family)|nr:carbohydrate kinase family protein [Subtercola sp.]